MSLFEQMQQHFVPSHKNSYRPRILRRSWLLFFIAVIFASEGMFVSSLFVGQGPSVSTPTVAAVASAPIASSLNTFVQNFGRQLARFAVDSRPAVPWVLGAVAALIIAALGFTFFMHIQIQQPEMLFSGALVALFALSLLATNAHIVRLL